MSDLPEVPPIPTGHVCERGGEDIFRNAAKVVRWVGDRMLDLREAVLAIDDEADELAEGLALGVGYRQGILRRVSELTCPCQAGIVATEGMVLGALVSDDDARESIERVVRMMDDPGGTIGDLMLGREPGRNP